MSAPKQITVLFNGKKQEVYLLDVDEVFIGRGRSAHIALDDNPIVSRKHAVLRAEGDVHILQDLGGANGTFLNDDRVTSSRVKEGDRIVFGKYSGTEIKVDGEERLILREDDILGVLD